LARFPAATGLLALLICAYLAAVYLAWESRDRALEDDFRRRAIVCWFAAGLVSVATLLLTNLDAPRLWSNLTTMPAVILVAGGALLAPASFAALWWRRFGAARVLGAAQITALLLGWGAAQWPYLIYPDLTVLGAAAPDSTLALTAATLPFGLAALVPSLWLLFSVFKGRNPKAG
jgi:cytochrome bd ubiquinol oxidase subunit II